MPASCPEPPLLRAGVPVPALGSRALFPNLDAIAYLAHAAISPLNLAGQLHVQAFLEAASEYGAHAFLPWAEQRSRLRALLARLMGVTSEDVALTAGTSYGLRDLALGLPLKAGDEIVTFQGEFPANVLSYRVAAERASAHVHYLPQPDPKAPEEVILEGLAARLERGARFVAVSAVQFQTGYYMPLEAMAKLCQRWGARLLVDAIQALGVLPLEVEALGLDAVVTGAHKWLLGVEGAGALFVSRDFFRSLRPQTLGWESLVGGEEFLFQGKGRLSYDLPALQSARAFEASTPNVPGHAALEAGVEICLGLGQAAIFEHIQRYHDALEPRLARMGLRSLRSPDPRRRSTLLSFDLPGDISLTKFVVELGRRKVVVSSPDGFVRFAPHFANSLDEVPEVAEAVAEVLRLCRP